MALTISEFQMAVMPHELQNQASYNLHKILGDQIIIKQTVSVRHSPCCFDWAATASSLLFMLMFWCLFQNDSSSSSPDGLPLHHQTDNRMRRCTSRRSSKVIPDRIFVHGFDHLVWPRHVFSNRHRCYLTWLTVIYQSITATLKCLLHKNVYHIAFIA